MSVDNGLQTFGRYVVIRSAGAGSVATVFRARHTELGRDAAIKVLHDRLRASPGAVESLRAEAAILIRLDHPHIVSLYDFVEEPGRTWLAEQWIDGAPLDAILDRHRRLTPEQALGVLTGALAGLAHAHEHGIVHRDVAASNILADTSGTSMLVDFGLAAPLDASGSAGVSGTPAYLSPEAARGEPVGKPGDVYSAAALTYHLLSGVPVFMGTGWEMVAAHRDRPAPPLTDHGPRLQALLERSLAKDAAARPPDAAAFLAELEQAATERYGAAWRTRASIAGLVVSTAASAAVLGAGIAATAPATVVAPVLPGAVASGTRVAVHTGRSVGLKVAAATLAGAVAIGGVVAFALTRGGDDDRNVAGAVDDPAAEDREPTAEELREQRRAKKLAELEAGLPDGQWSLVSTIVSTDFTDEAVGDSTRSVWTLSPTCPSLKDCGGTVSSTSGSTFAFTWTGDRIVVSRQGRTSGSEQTVCIDTVTGLETPGSSARASWRHDPRIVLKATGFDADGAPRGFRGRTTYVVSFSDYVNCNRADPLRAVYRWALTPR